MSTSSIRFDLTGKRVVVTGASSGIGLETASLLAESGARVCLNHLASDERGPDAVRRLKEAGFTVFSAPGDVGDPDDAARMVEGAIRELGGLDYLINNAGTSGTTQPIAFADLDAMSEDFWNTILTTNLVGPFRCARAAAGALTEARGSIVNTASVAGLGMRGSSIAYAASKAGLINLTNTLARALAPNVRVNAVAPGLVETPWTQEWSDERKLGTISRTLLERMASPREVAEAIVFLAAGPAYINAHTLVINGGAG